MISCASEMWQLDPAMVTQDLPLEVTEIFQRDSGDLGLCCAEHLVFYST